MRYRCVIWDWNGTLADDVIASLKATNDILARHGKPPIDLAQYYAYMDTPISRFYEHLFDLNEVPMTLIGREFSEFYPRYFEGLHPGAVTLLRTLQSAGVRQVILSSSHRENVERDTAAQGIRPYFDEILAADDLGRAFLTGKGFITLSGCKHGCQYNCRWCKLPPMAVFITHIILLSP